MGGGDELVKQTKPTKLIGQPICRLHKDTYNMLDWVGNQFWKDLQEAARSKGFILELGKSVTVTFQHVGYVPKRYLEIER